MWILVGVFALLGGQSSEAGTGNHAPRKDGARSLEFQRYVALGDSYTAGAGIPPGETHGCLRSGRSYPRRLAERLDARLVDVSCAGATTANVAAAQDTDLGPVAPQLAAVDPRADLVTVSLGVNDAGFGLILSLCSQLAPTDPQGAPCRAHFQTPAGDSLLSNVRAVGQRVKRTLRLVRRTAPDAQVVLIGYPQLAPQRGSCDELPFARGDYPYLQEFLVDVDLAMASAAKRQGVLYVSLIEPSKGHDICAGNEAWVVGAQPSSRAMSWHPFANEQRAVVALVVEALDKSARQRRERREQDALADS